MNIVLTGRQRGLFLSILLIIGGAGVFLNSIRAIRTETFNRQAVEMSRYGILMGLILLICGLALAYHLIYQMPMDY